MITITIEKEVFIISKYSKGLLTLLLGALLFAAPVSAFAQDLPEIFSFSKATEAQESSEINFQTDNLISDNSSFKLKADKIGTDSARLSWSGDKTFISYTLCRYNIFTEAWEEYAKTSEDFFELSDLAEDTDYRFSLHANTGEVLDTVEFTTKVKNVKLVVKDRSSDSITLCVKTGSDAKAVKLYRSTDNEHFSLVENFSGGDYTDSGLEEATTYYYKVKSVIKRGGEKRESALGEVKSVTTLKPLAVPESGGAVKTFAYYTAVTVKSSPQYKLLNSPDCTTDPETGVRMVDGCYCVAMGSFYGTTIGTKYKVTFEDGKQINVILCDAKSDRHTNETHQYGAQNKDILEFYIEKAKIPTIIRNRGNYGNLPQFSGAIKSIEQYMD